jgi:hypothetical protein
MNGKVKRKTPEIVLREGKPSAVILDIDEYRQMLGRLEDLEDLNMLKEMRKRPLKFRKLEDFLKEYHPSVGSPYPTTFHRIIPHIKGYL